ncbi:peroxiredoxin 2 [Phyllostomus discolor]|uniref:thioredoxin-dependent peroxiredoxin n=1 Tax=Phyllostomus discolor TaxID=89673 RepID=A0A834EWW5_9CHIR|nr:peroxiredoxin 2 [Phyllostomus discolor]
MDHHQDPMRLMVYLPGAHQSKLLWGTQPPVLVPFGASALNISEIIAFSEHAEDFCKLGCEVLGVSVDLQFTHLAWINTPQKEGSLGPLNIPLLADVTRNLSHDYGVLKKDEGIAYRGLFIIHGKGVLHRLTVNDLPLGLSVDEAPAGPGLSVHR